MFNTRGIGPKSMHRIYEGLRDNPSFKSEMIDKLTCSPPDSELEERFRKLKDQNVHIIHLGSPLYPSRILEILGKDAPPLLFCKGRLSLLKAKSIAIAGSRNASDKALQSAYHLAAQLALEGVNVVSGYAKGVDTKAHLGTLKAGGTTTVVLSYGIYQFHRKKVFDKTPWDGNVLIISQFPERAKWSARNAMTRNKLICALSMGVIIIEAKEGGGTFNTGLTALKLGIPLFILSPSEFDLTPAGNIKLLEMGGREIRLKDGIREVLGGLDKSKREEPKQLLLPI